MAHDSRMVLPASVEKGTDGDQMGQKYYKLSETYQHLSPFAKRWITGHIIILFLMSYSIWEG